MKYLILLLIIPTLFFGQDSQSKTVKRRESFEPITNTGLTPLEKVSNTNVVTNSGLPLEKISNTNLVTNTRVALEKVSNTNAAVTNAGTPLETVSNTNAIVTNAGTPLEKVSNTNILPMSSDQISNANLSATPTPKIGTLPELETVSSILTPDVSIENLKERFSESKTPYQGGNVALYPIKSSWGIWWRFYTQNTSLFNITALSEEMLIIEEKATALWIQDIKTEQTVQSQSQRLLQISMFDILDNLFFVFHYKNQDPFSEEVREKQGFFVRILEEQGYMQMSKSPNFEPENSIYWRRFPRSR